MGMQHRAGAPRPHDGQVKSRLGRGLARAGHDLALLIDRDDLVDGEEPLIDAGGRDREPQGVAAHDGAEMAARAEGPAASVALEANFDDLYRQLGETHASTIQRVMTVCAVLLAPLIPNRNVLCLARIRSVEMRRVFAVVLLAIACGPEPTDSALSALIVMGDGQQGTVGTTLPLARIGQAIDSRGRPARRLDVRWQR